MTDEERRTKEREYRRRYRSDPANVKRERERELKRYAKHREKNLARQQSDEGRAVKKAWAERNPENVLLHKRLSEARRRERRAGTKYLDPQASAYASILTQDPCAYCGGLADTLDHIEPIAAGGSTSWENLTAACRSCNSRKSDNRMLFWMAVTTVTGVTA